MKNNIFLAAPAVVLAVFLVSCASFQNYKDERDVEHISELINTGNAEKLIALSELPFLLDQEIIVLKKDIESFWTNVVKAGFTVNEPELERGTPVDDKSYLEFYDSMEVKTFFKKYLPGWTRLLELKTGSGQRILLLVENRIFTPKNRQIHGFKGPF